MRSTLDSALPWWVAGPPLGLVIVSLCSTHPYLLMCAAVAVAFIGVKLQPRLARAAEQATQSSEARMPVVQGAEVL